MIQAFIGATPVLIYLVAGWLLDRGSGLSSGTIVAFTTLQSQLFFPVARLLETTVELQSSRALFRRIFDYLDTEPDIVEAESPVELSREQVKGVVAFEDVEFAYGDGPATLHGVSFEARPGQLVAFVGPSGSGKSTVLSLVARLYDPGAGRVAIDGTDLRELSFGSVADLMGFVTQESYLFAGTLRDNICYGKPDATDAEAEKAARAAALDTASERRIQSALDELISGRTTLAVAHRLSTIQAADVIHVFDHGHIIESGNHDELLARGGAYAELHREQFGNGEIETTSADGIVFRDGRCQLFVGGVPER